VGGQIGADMVSADKNAGTTIAGSAELAARRSTSLGVGPSTSTNAT
jgi:hypothetical protein